jgi:hypothetical protein
MSVMSRQVRTCRPEDGIQTAIATMREAQVHRLPVVDARGVLVGVLSTNDLVRAAQSRPAAVDAAAVVKCLAAIGAPRRAASVAPAPSAPAGKAIPAVAPASGRAVVAAPTPPVAKAAAAPATEPPAAGPAKGKPKAKKARKG